MADAAPQTETNNTEEEELGGPREEELGGPREEELGRPREEEEKEVEGPKSEEELRGPREEELGGPREEVEKELGGPREEVEKELGGPREEKELRGPREEEELRGPREEEELRGPREEEELGRPTGEKEDEHAQTEGHGRPQRPAPPSSLLLSSSDKTWKKKVLSAPNLSLSLGGGSVKSEDLSGVLSPSLDELELDLEALETPSDSESLLFPLHDLELDLHEDMMRLGVGSCRASSSRRRSLGLEPEDTVDGQGSRWRSLTSNGQQTQVNMSLIQDYVQVISHGGYYGDEENDIILFSSCFLPENSISEYQQVMDHLFRYVMGTLELMVSQNYLIIYLCAGAQRNQVPSISWLRECYTTIDRRLRKNLKGFLVVHPNWFIKAVITVVKPFISSKFSRKLRFVDSLLELSMLVPLEQIQIPACVKEFDQTLSR